MNFAAAIAAAADTSPHVPSMEASDKRILIIDGDQLAYYCAGKDGTDPAEARVTLMDKVAAAKRAAGAARVILALTPDGSEKGKRYAIATVKPYQGKRSGSSKPANWRYLRDFMESGRVAGAEIVLAAAEADDYAAYHVADNLEKGGDWLDVAIMSQDKDWRMIPGLHLEWVTHTAIKVPPGVYCVEKGGLTYGRKWFWHQMLRGDPTDDIPGLPKYVDRMDGTKRVEKLLGDVTAEFMLAGTHSEDGAWEKVQYRYQQYYGNETWLMHVVEQACLLWLRTSPNADVMNVCAAGNPLERLWHEPYLQQLSGVISELGRRIAAVPAEVDGGDAADDSGTDVDGAAQDVQALSASSFLRQGSDGPRPLDGPVPGSAALVVQCPVGEGRERGQSLRREEPLGIPAWVRYLLADRAPAAVYLPDTQDARGQTAASQQAGA